MLFNNNNYALIFGLILGILIGFVAFSHPNAKAYSAHYTSMTVPAVNSSWKTYEPISVFNKYPSSAQYKMLHKWAWADGSGFMRVNNEKDLGITDPYYCAAMGKFYSSKIGDKFRITTDVGKVFYVIVGDWKGGSEVNANKQYGLAHKDILEMIVNTPTLISSVKQSGNCNNHTPISGSITKIEKISFY